MNHNKKSDGSVIIPTLNIENEIQPLLNDIELVTKVAETICILCPIALVKLQKISKQKLNITHEYYQIINRCYNLLASPVEGAKIAADFAQSWSIAKGLSAIMKLQESWRNLDALIDRKYTYSIAIISLYLGIISVLLSILNS
jgi:hypothetical protein